jgi:hypothetical protein
MILLGEELPFGANFRFGRREWRFLFYGLGCALIVALPAMVIATAASVAVGVVAKAAGIESGWFLVAPVMIAVGLFVYPVVARLMLVLPAIAVDEGPPYLARAWARTRGNALRLFFGMIICALPLSLLTSLVDMAAGKIAPDNTAVTLVIQAILLIANFLAVAVYVGFLSFAYDQLGGVTSRPAEEEAPAAEM